MSNNKLSVQRLEKAISRVAPERAHDVARNYEAVMAVLNQTLVAPVSSPEQEIARSAHDKLAALAGSIIDEGKLFMVRDLDRELKALPKSVIGNPEASEAFAMIKRNEAKRYFRGLSETFSKNFAISIPKSYVNVYLSLPEPQRVQISYINTYFSEIFKIGRSSEVLTTMVHDRQSEILEALAAFCYGDRITGGNKLRYLKIDLRRVAAYEQLKADFQQNTGISIPGYELNIVFATMKDRTGIEPIATVNLIKEAIKLAPEQFASLKLRPDQLREMLLTAAIRRLGGTKRELDYLKTRAYFEVAISTKEDAARRHIARQVAEIENANRLLQSDSKRPPVAGADRMLRYHDKAAQELRIAIARKKIVVSENYLLEYQIERDFINSYLAKPKIGLRSKATMAVIQDILTAKTFHELSAVSNKYKVQSPRLHIARSAEIALINAIDEVDNKRFVSENSGAMFEMAATGKISHDNKQLMTTHIVMESEKLSGTLNGLIPLQKAEKEYFDRVYAKHNSLSKFSPKERGLVESRARGYLTMLLHSMYLNGKLLAVDTSSEMLGGTDIQKKDLNYTRQVIEFRKREIAKVAKFLEIKGLSAPSVDQIAISPLHEPLLAEAKDKYLWRYKYALEPVVENRNELLKFQGINWAKELNPGLKFRLELGKWATLISSIKTARTEVTKLQIDLLARRKQIIDGTDPFILKHPELAKAWTGTVDNGLTQLKSILESKDSLISSASLARITAKREELKLALEKHYDDILKNMALVSTIFLVAVGGAVALGYVATEFLMTSSVIGNALTATAATSAGGVVGSRIAMQGISSSSLHDFGDFRIWDLQEMAKEFGIGWAFSLGVVGAAKGAVTSLGKLSTSMNQYAPNAVARNALDSMDFIKRVASPTDWFQGYGQGHLSRLWAGFVREVPEETLQTVAGRIHPVAEAVLTLGSATPGVDVNSSMLGLTLDAKTLDNPLVDGLSLRTLNTVPTIMTKQVEEQGVDVREGAKPLGDGIDLSTAEGARRVSDEVQGRATRALDVTTEANQVANVHGIEVINGVNTITNEVNIVPAINELKALGFIITRAKNGLNLVKGAFSTFVEISAQAMSQFKATINEIGRMSKEAVVLLQSITDDAGLTPENGRRLSFLLAGIGASLIGIGTVEAEGIDVNDIVQVAKVAEQVANSGFTTGDYLWFVIDGLFAITLVSSILIEAPRAALTAFYDLGRTLSQMARGPLSSRPDRRKLLGQLDEVDALLGSANSKVKNKSAHLREAAETARTVAKTAETNAEDARNKAETAETNAEDARDKAETARTEAEEKRRIEDAAVLLEDERNRVWAEAVRLEAEADRLEAEAVHLEAEADRSEAEAGTREKLTIAEVARDKAKAELDAANANVKTIEDNWVVDKKKLEGARLDVNEKKEKLKLAESAVTEASKLDGLQRARLNYVKNLHRQITAFLGTKSKTFVFETIEGGKDMKDRRKLLRSLKKTSGLDRKAAAKPVGDLIEALKDLMGLLATDVTTDKIPLTSDADINDAFIKLKDAIKDVEAVKKFTISPLLLVSLASLAALLAIYIGISTAISNAFDHERLPPYLKLIGISPTLSPGEGAEGEASGPASLQGGTPGTVPKVPMATQPTTDTNEKETPGTAPAPAGNAGTPGEAVAEPESAESITARAKKLAKRVLNTEKSPTPEDEEKQDEDQKKFEEEFEDAGLL